MQINVASNDAINDPGILDAFALARGYQDLVGGFPNPQTKAQFLKQDIIDYIKTHVFIGQNIKTPPSVNVG